MEKSVYKKGGKHFIVPEKEKKKLAQQGKFSDPITHTPEEKEERRTAEIENTARKGLDIENAKERMKIEDEKPKVGDVLMSQNETRKETGMEFKPREQMGKNEILDIQRQLDQPATGKTLDTINRWRLQVKLDNTLKQIERPILGGSLPIGIPVSAVTAMGGSAWRGVGQLVGTPTGGGLIGSTVTNAKTVALTGNWLLKAGFSIKAAAWLGGLIGLVAWGKHVKSEAIEFLPYQIQESYKAGDAQSAKELEKLFNEIKDPIGWGNIIEEIPGLGVIKAALDKMKAGSATIKAIEKRAG